MGKAKSRVWSLVAQRETGLLGAALSQGTPSLPQGSVADVPLSLPCLP